MKSLIIAAAALLFVTSMSNGQTATPAINHTQQVQEKKINQGIKSGEVTKKEASKLDAQQNKIQHDKKAARSDGVVTHKEKKQLKKEQHHANKNIHKQKHDAQTQHHTK